jgi:hypothetical protein
MISSNLNLVILITVALTFNSVCLSNADLSDALNEAKSAYQNTCLTDDNCNTEFFKLKNYCCLSKVQCCDWFTYVLRDNE